jgi:hypothetical protein
MEMTEIVRTHGGDWRTVETENKDIEVPTTLYKILEAHDSLSDTRAAHDVTRRVFVTNPSDSLRKTCLARSDINYEFRPRHTGHEMIADIELESESIETSNSHVSEQTLTIDRFGTR